MNVSVCVCVCVCVCACACVGACMCVETCTRKHTRAHTYNHTCTHTSHTYTHARTYTRTHTTHTRTHTPHTHTRTHARTHTHTHTHTHKHTRPHDCGPMRNNRPNYLTMFTPLRGSRAGGWLYVVASTGPSPTKILSTRGLYTLTRYCTMSRVCFSVNICNCRDFAHQGNSGSGCLPR